MVFVCGRAPPSGCSPHSYPVCAVPLSLAWPCSSLNWQEVYFQAHALRKPESFCFSDLRRHMPCQGPVTPRPPWDVGAQGHDWVTKHVFINKPGLPWRLEQQRICLQCRGNPDSIPWGAAVSWGREWQPTAVFLPGESRGQQSLVGYSPWGLKESGMTEATYTHIMSIENEDQDWDMEKISELSKTHFSCREYSLKEMSQTTVWWVGQEKAGGERACGLWVSGKQPRVCQPADLGKGWQCLHLCVVFVLYKEKLKPPRVTGF